MNTSILSFALLNVVLLVVRGFTVSYISVVAIFPDEQANTQLSISWEPRRVSLQFQLNSELQVLFDKYNSLLVSLEGFHIFVPCFTQFRALVVGGFKESCISVLWPGAQVSTKFRLNTASALNGHLQHCAYFLDRITSVGTSTEVWII